MGSKITKLDMARVVVAALYNMKSLPATDHREVRRFVRRLTVEQLKEEHKRALSAINSADGS